MKSLWPISSGPKPIEEPLPAACLGYRQWLQSPDVAADPAALISLHGRDCEGCSALLARYNAAKLKLQDQLPSPVPGHNPQGAQQAFLIAAGRQAATGSRMAPTRWTWAAVPAAMALAIWGWQTTSTESTETSINAPGLVSEHRAPETIPSSAEPTSESKVDDLKPPARQYLSGERIVTSDSEIENVSHLRAGQLQIRSASAVLLRRWDAEAVEVELFKGAVQAKVHPRHAESPFEIITPYAVVSVVGTAFEVVHVPGHRTTVNVFDGVVDVLTTDRSPLARLLAGESIDVEAPRAATPQQPVAQAESEPEADSELPAPALNRSGRQRMLVNSATITTSSPLPVATKPQVAPTAPETLEAPSPQDASLQDAALQNTLRNARRALAAGRDAETLKILDAVPAAQIERSADAQGLRGDALRLMGRQLDAANAYRKAAAASSAQGRGRWLVECAEALWKAGHTKEAEAEWQAALDLQTGDRYEARSLASLARLRVGRGERDAAAALWAQILARHAQMPEAEQALAEHGRSLLQQDQFGAAEALFSKYRQSRPGLAEVALVGLMRVHLSRGDRTRATELASEYAARFPRGRLRADIQKLEVKLTGP